MTVYHKALLVACEIGEVDKNAVVDSVVHLGRREWLRGLQRHARQGCDAQKVLEDPIRVAGQRTSAYRHRQNQADRQ